MTTNQWNMRTGNDFINFTHSLTGVRVIAYPRPDCCELGVSRPNSRDNVFDWDPITDVLTWNTYWPQFERDPVLAGYAQLILETPECKEKLKEVAIRVMEHFASLKGLQATPEGVLTMHLGDFGDQDTKQFDFRTMRFRDKLDGQWQQMRLEDVKGEKYFTTKVYDEDFDEIRWVDTFCWNSKYYHEIVYQQFKDWCIKTGRAKQITTIDDVGDLRFVKIDYELPTKGERPDHLQLVK